MKRVRADVQLKSGKLSPSKPYLAGGSAIARGGLSPLKRVTARLTARFGEWLA
jgi:hypothetical protein